MTRDELDRIQRIVRLVRRLGPLRRFSIDRETGELCLRIGLLTLDSYGCYCATPLGVSVSGFSNYTNHNAIRAARNEAAHRTYRWTT